ncbi:chitinase-like protein EN03 [Hetaerina americana]|uniref:chitinase-like protein EN03 n=1 Tax=Hetaerina americana TaxID=62018 RepID=UPI003A7F4869
MMARTLLALALAVAASATIVAAQQDYKVVCYYDSRAHWRHGQGRMRAADIDPTLCTHLVYGPAKLNPENFHLQPYNAELDLESGRGNYMEIAGLKARNPRLTILLGVGIWPAGLAEGLDPVDPDEPDYFAASEPYQTLIEHHEKRDAFIESARALVKRAGFDGMDLAWPFPKEPFKKDRGTLGQWWHSVRRKFGSGRSDTKPEPDDVSTRRRNGFAALVREAKSAFSRSSTPLYITVTSPPTTNVSAYFDVHSIMSQVDQIHLMAFDNVTPFRQKTKASQPAPLYVNDPHLNSADSMVRKWLSLGAPGRKLVLGIPAFGRTWRLPEGVLPTAALPPATSEGPGEVGPYTNTLGMLAYYEICHNISHPGIGDMFGLSNFPDPTRKLGPYAHRCGDHNPIWVGYDDLDFAGAKAAYAKSKGLGGIAMWDISLDDFGGVCSVTKFPLLRAAKARLV